MKQVHFTAIQLSVNELCEGLVTLYKRLRDTGSPLAAETRELKEEAEFLAEYVGMKDSEPHRASLTKHQVSELWQNGLVASA